MKSIVSAAAVAALVLVACGDEDSEPADGAASPQSSAAATSDAEPQFTDSLPEDSGTRTGRVGEPGAIDGTDWLLVAYSVDGEEADVQPGIEATLFVDGDTVSLQTGCNAGSGGVEFDDTTITLGDLALTRALCFGPAGETETAVLGTFRNRAGYEVAGETLTVTRDGPQRSFALEYAAG